MGLFDFFKDYFKNTSETTSIEINPANGLPMVDGILDVEGNVYGCSSNFAPIDHFTDDITRQSSCCDTNNDISTSLFNDDWCENGSIGDDSFGSCFSE